MVESWHLVVEEFVEFGRSHYAFCGIVDIHIYYITTTSLHTHTLLTEWHQQFLVHQTPIEESTHLVHLIHAHQSKIAHHGIRCFGGCHRAVFRIVIHKHVEHVVDLLFACEVAFRKQHFVCLTVDKI